MQITYVDDCNGTTTLNLQLKFTYIPEGEIFIGINDTFSDPSERIHVQTDTMMGYFVLRWPKTKQFESRLISLQPQHSFNQYGWCPVIYDLGEQKRLIIQILMPGQCTPLRCSSESLTMIWSVGGQTHFYIHDGWERTDEVLSLNSQPVIFQPTRQHYFREISGKKPSVNLIFLY